LSRPLIFTIYYTSFGTFFHKAIQELITISEGDMRKVRQEAVMTANVFLLKLTSYVTMNSCSDKNYGEMRFF